MAQDPIEQVKQVIIGEYVEWVKRFDVNDYIKNRPMIEKLYEEKQLALTTSMQLEKRLKNLENKYHELELQNQKYKIQLDEIRQKSLSILALSLVATLLVGFGVNIITSGQYTWTGWVMVGIACILEGVAFYLRPKEG